VDYLQSLLVKLVLDHLPLSDDVHERSVEVLLRVRQLGHFLNINFLEQSRDTDFGDQLLDLLALSYNERV